MPYELMRDVCEILDAGDTWEQIVDPKHYHLEDYALSSGYDVLRTGKQVHSSASMKAQQGSVTTPSGVKRIDAPSTSGTTITKPSTALSTTGLSTTGSDPLISALQHTLAVPFSELEVATNNFSSSNIIGKGGYGVVFVGEWKHTKIAVKRINASGDKGNEVSTFFPQWPLVVEVDAEEKSPLIASHIKGTLAYLPPEFITNRILSTKLDVYSFGIVLLEIATGLRAYVDSRVPHSLVDYCSHVSMRHSEDGCTSWIDTLIDKRTPRCEHIAGELFVDGFAVPTGGVDLDKMHLMCAPYRFGRPAVLCASRSDILSVNYKLNRLKYRLKEPKIITIYRKEMFVPLSMRSMCHFDRSAFFTSAFQPYTNECQKEMDLLFNRINSKRNEGMKCVIIPTGGKGAGKSTLVRYLINRLIHHDRPPVYLLDVDVGQTEFTPAGCMSLWKLTMPILDLPFTHQQLFYSSSYFYGNISPADDTAKYKDIFDRLLNEFNSHSDPGSLVVINTMGWLEVCLWLLLSGLGKDLLDYIFEMSRPFLAIVLPHDRGAYQVILEFYVFAQFNS
uniref:Protein kinase domain-containing protein n=1 Tax=Heterorhabditis bacteriophora TaxID=37862 RepID=A0A1I7XF87_HETBA